MQGFVQSIEPGKDLYQNLYGVWNGVYPGNLIDNDIRNAWNGDSEIEKSLIKSAYNFNSNTNDSHGGINATKMISFGTYSTTYDDPYTYTTGKVNAAFLFNGDIFLSIPNDGLKFENDFAFSMWVSVPSTATASKIGIISCRGKGYPEMGWRLEYDSGTLSFICESDPVDGIYATRINHNYTQFTLNEQWTHIAVSKKRFSSPNIYINGSTASVNTLNLNGASDTMDIFYPLLCNSYIGTTHVNGILTTAPSAFKIDSLVTFNSDLEYKHIIESYNNGLGISYPYGDNGNELYKSYSDLVGTASSIPMNGAYITKGISGYSFNFDGINDFISVTPNTLNFTGDFSVSFWALFSDISTDGCILSNLHIDGLANGWGIFRRGTSISLDIMNNSNNPYGAWNWSSNVRIMGGTVSVGNWHYITVTNRRNTFSSNEFLSTESGTFGECKIYIDGELVQTSANTVNPSYNVDEIKCSIGAWHVRNNLITNYHNGRIDSLNTWTRVLSEDEVKMMYNGGAGVSYPFTNKFLDSAKDNWDTNHGTMCGSASFSKSEKMAGFSFEPVGITYSYVALPDNSLNFGTSSFAVSLWYSPNDGLQYSDSTGTFSTINGEQPLISSYSGSTQSQYGNGWILSAQPYGISFKVMNGSTYSFYVVPYNWSSVENTETHIVLSRDVQTETTNVFINSALRSGFYWNDNYTDWRDLVTISEIINNNWNQRYGSYWTANYGAQRYSLPLWGVDPGSDGTHKCNIGGSYNKSQWYNTDGEISMVSVWKRPLQLVDVWKLYFSAEGRMIYKNPELILSPTASVPQALYTNSKSVVTNSPKNILLAKDDVPTPNALGWPWRKKTKIIKNLSKPITMNYQELNDMDTDGKIVKNISKPITMNFKFN